MKDVAQLERLSCGQLATRDPDIIRARVAAAGVVGAGGAGFPTAVKLKGQVEIFLVNAAECEPMLKVDQQLMPREAGRMVRGLLYGMAATGAREGIVALKEKYREAIAALTPILPPQVRLHILPDVYPAGDEVITIWLATGRRVPPAQLPGSVGVVVNNVQTLINVARAVEDEAPVTHRTLTINGAVARPVTVTVPLGVTFREMLALAGGATVPDPGFIDGGPMMGQLVTDLGKPVGKTCGGILVFPRAHQLIRTRERSDRDILAIARTVCEQCRLCTELCPRHIIGHELPPHLLVRAANYSDVASPRMLLSALTCSECNVCAAYSCPVDISPMRINRMLKAKFRAANARYEGPLHDADPMAQYRLLPVKRLINKLDLNDWYKPAPFDDAPYVPKEVILPLRQHIGAAASPLVAKGDKVGLGQCIGAVPDGALGAPVHASIAGIVAAVTDASITIIQG